MPKVMMNNFTAGEFSPRLHARTDLEKYQSGCKELHNFLIQAQGGVYGRPGTRFVAPAKFSDKVTRLLPFEFSTVQAYILEMGNAYLRFYKDGGQIVSGGPYEIVTPYLETDVFGVKYAQSADTMYLAHSSYAPRKLTRTNHAAWTLTIIDFVDGPYMTVNKDITKTLLMSAHTVGVGRTMTAAGHSPFQAGHIGSLWRVSGNTGTGWGYVKVTGFTSATVVTVDVKTLIPGAVAATSWWREGAFSIVRGYPSSVGFTEERLMWASTPSEQQTIWGSVSGNFEEMTPGTSDDDAVTYTVASSYVNPFHWMIEDRGTILGTTKAQFRLQGTNESPLSPSNARAFVQTNYGSKSVSPIKIGDSTLFVARASRKIRALEYSFDKDSYSAPDLTLLSEHITEPGVVDWCYQQEPDSILAAVLLSGWMATMTYISEQKVMGWAQHSTQGFFRSVACIPVADYDQLWFIVDRVVGGSTVKYIEYSDPLLNMDCALSYSGAPVSSVSGLGHLEGLGVVIVGDGAVYNNQTVVAGSVDLLPDGAAEDIDVGLSFTPRLVTLKPERPDTEGVTAGRRMRWVDIGVRLLETSGVEVNGTLSESHSNDATMDERPDPFTGDEITVNLGWDREGSITIQQTLPLPINILGVFGLLEVGD